jgi:hypothetical protein
VYGGNLLEVEGSHTYFVGQNGVWVYNCGGGACLNARQAALLEQLRASAAGEVIVSRRAVNMRDLSALTAETGQEFALFTCRKQRLIIMGDVRSVPVNLARAEELARQGWRWSGHTHPGITDTVLHPSWDDRCILEQFLLHRGQQRSATFNSLGQFRPFRPPGLWLPGK